MVGYDRQLETRHASTYPTHVLYAVESILFDRMTSSGMISFTWPRARGSSDLRLEVLVIALWRTCSGAATPRVPLSSLRDYAKQALKT